jgi:23S rRNA (pseudouridine1915-N3)-methyltransferase
MPIRIVCLGKTREAWIKQGITEYLKRLEPYWKIRLVELKDVSLNVAGSTAKVKDQEAVILMKTIGPEDYVIALDEKGSSLDSVGFSKLLDELLASREIVFVIGGVYGLDTVILQRADRILSFSAFTFPHQLIRLLLVEQLYRARTISSGKTYHY